MNNQRKFIFGCIPVRLLIVYVAYKIPKQYLPYMGMIALIIAIGFMKAFIQSKQSDRGFFGNKVWWNSLRLVHFIMYFLFFIATTMHYSYAWVLLLMDIAIGTMATLGHYNT